jgi:hypothetical protein
MPLWYPHTRAIFFQPGIPRSMQYAINQGLLSLDNNAYDCVSASALSILKLLDLGVHQQYKIEQFYRISGTTPYTHSFVVVNRNKGDCANPYSWNDGAVFICAWYKVCFSVAELRNDPSLLEKYFLIKPVACQVYEVNPKGNLPPAYQYALIEFKGKIESKELETTKAAFLRYKY